MDPNDKNRPTVYRSAIDFINRADFRPFAISFKKKNGQKNRLTENKICRNAAEFINRKR